MIRDPRDVILLRCRQINHDLRMALIPPIVILAYEVILLLALLVWIFWR